MALAFLIGSAVAWDNGVARTPPLGYSNWNNFHNNINSSLFIETASMFADVMINKELLCPTCADMHILC